MNKFQQLSPQDQETIKQILGGNINESIGDSLKKLSFAGLIVLGSLLSKQASSQSLAPQYGANAKVNFGTVNKVIDSYTRTIFGNKAQEVVNSGIVPTIASDGSVIYFKLENRFKLPEGDFIAFKVNKYNKIDLVTIDSNAKLLRNLDYTNLSGEEAMNMVEKLTMGRINQTLRDPSTVVAQTNIQKEHKMKTENLRKLIRESINNVVTEMANIAKIIKLTPDWESKLNMADESIKLSRPVTKMIEFLKQNPEGSTLKASAEAIYGVVDTALTSGIIRLLKSVGVVQEDGLERPKKEKPESSGISGRPKIMDDDKKTLGISVIRKYSKGDTSFTPEEIEFIDALYQSARFGEEEETLDEADPTTLPKPVTKPTTAPEKPGIRRPLNPPTTAPDTKPKAEAEIVNKIEQRYNKLK